jgi:hypothetical protein
MEDIRQSSEALANQSLVEQASSLAVDIGKNVLHGAAVVIDNTVDVLNYKGDLGIDDKLARVTMTVLRFLPVIGTIIQGAEEIDRYRGEGRLSHFTGRLRENEPIEEIAD